jgi:restriction system protein
VKLLEAVAKVLSDAMKPLSAPEITEQVLGQGLWTSGGKTPSQTIHAQLAVDIRDQGEASRFQRTARGRFALRDWGLPEFAPRRATTSSLGEPPLSGSVEGAILAGPEGPAAGTSTLSFLSAAERVLRQEASGAPMHYRRITEEALRLGLLRTAGKTPQDTMYAQILTEIGRKTLRGETPRFTKHGKGMVGLTEWVGSGLVTQIEQHNAKVRQQLHTRLRRIPPPAFEDLIGALLVKLGFENVAVTSRGNDGGIDVRGILVVGDVVRLRMAVQVKRWKQNIQAPTVQQLRGALGAHEQGLIITTSGFSSGARQEAKRADAVPVGLMDGDQLVALMVQNDLGIQRESHDLIELDGNAQSLCPHARPTLPVGSLVQFPFGGTLTEARVTEDRGPLGARGRRIYAVTLCGDPADSLTFEMPEDELTPVSGGMASLQR